MDLCHIPTVLLDPREVMGMATTPWFHFEPPRCARVRRQRV